MVGMAQAMASTSNRSSSTGKTLILCFDGTGDYFDDSNTNVEKLFELLDKSDTTKQMCYYQPGIGTYAPPSVMTPITSWVVKTLDEAFAWYIGQHITSGYAFLANNWMPGDKICIFGFSRGAYTARALAGMLEKVGLLQPDNWEMSNFAYMLYKDWKPLDANAIAQCQRFKRSFSREVQIDFIGVWDTVGSVGSLAGRHLPFANQASKYFRQAIALDEHRVKFPINRFHAEASTEGDAANDPEYASSPSRDTDGDNGNDLKAGPPPVLEVWFAGCHADVGGGSALNTTALQLSNISLNWMIAQVLTCTPEIHLDQSRLAIINTAYIEAIQDHTNGSVTNANSTAPIRDPLWNFVDYNGKFSLGSTFMTFFWSFLEILPLRRRFQHSVSKVWRISYWPHNRKPRVVPRGASIHTSVKDKVALGGYTPRPKLVDVKYVST